MPIEWHVRAAAKKLEHGIAVHDVAESVGVTGASCCVRSEPITAATASSDSSKAPSLRIVPLVAVDSYQAQIEKLPLGSLKPVDVVTLPSFPESAPFKVPGLHVDGPLIAKSSFDPTLSPAMDPVSSSNFR